MSVKRSENVTRKAKDLVENHRVLTSIDSDDNI